MQEAYAASLLESGDAKLLRLALAQWKQIAGRSQPNQPRWVKAQYSVALALFRLGDKAAAGAALRAVLDNPRSLTPEWKAKYQK